MDRRTSPAFACSRHGRFGHRVPRPSPLFRIHKWPPIGRIFCLRRNRKHSGPRRQRTPCPRMDERLQHASFRTLVAARLARPRRPWHPPVLHPPPPPVLARHPSVSCPVPLVYCLQSPVVTLTGIHDPPPPFLPLGRPAGRRLVALAPFRFQKITRPPSVLHRRSSRPENRRSHVLPIRLGRHPPPRQSRPHRMLSSPRPLGNRTLRKPRRRPRVLHHHPHRRIRSLRPSPLPFQPNRPRSSQPRHPRPRRLRSPHRQALPRLCPAPQRPS